MSSLQRWLLVPCLAPLAAVLLASAFNSSGNTRLQLLIWRSPPLPIGAWTALAGLTGAGLSAVSVLLLVPTTPPLRRQRHHRWSDPDLNRRCVRWSHHRPNGMCANQPPPWPFPTGLFRNRTPKNEPPHQNPPPPRERLITPPQAQTAGALIRILIGETRPTLTTVLPEIRTR